MHGVVLYLVFIDHELCLVDKGKLLVTGCITQTWSTWEEFTLWWMHSMLNVLNIEITTTNRWQNEVMIHGLLVVLGIYMQKYVISRHWVCIGRFRGPIKQDIAKYSMWQWPKFWKADQLNLGINLDWVWYCTLMSTVQIRLSPGLVRD